ncbi:hypothetical protein AB6Q56_14430 [Dechloromonas sp. ARDL1]|uniref:hypothetical protein n=1 Tax=Dechloromonas sp. ARDL1 TaxID=3322121 RepID=UPI003DA6F1E3
MNYLRNNMTGATYNFDSAPLAQNVMALDYSSPIEVYGQKGYRIKGDPAGVMLADGRKVTLEQNPGLADARQMQALNMDRARLNNQLLESQIRAASQRETPTLQHVETPNGPMSFNPKTGQYAPIGMPGGAPIQSKEQAQRGQDATAVMELTDEAAPLLEKAPGSYAGAALNQLGRVFGMNTEATNAQAQMDVISGTLVAKMPKMTGPQSDKDVLLYRQMAGNLNDPTVPTSAKQAAMKTLRMLNEKYVNQQVGGMQPSGAAGDAIRQARQAISSGAPKDAVIRRLQQLGITDHGIQ